MPALNADERRWVFDEVNSGYTMEMAKLEASRCLDCANPRCMAGCPVSINIPGFIMAIGNDDMPGALEIIKETNALPGVCGRVCPQEEQCEKVCVVGIKNKPVGIGNLERFVADYNREHHERDLLKAPASGKKVAVIGAGPAGVVAAETIRKLDKNAHISIIGDEPEAPYSRMAIPYYLEENIQGSQLGELQTFFFTRDLNHNGRDEIYFIEYISHQKPPRHI